MSWALIVAAVDALPPNPLSPAPLSPAEEALLGPHATAKRRREFHAGRGAAKQAVTQWCGAHAHILREPGGRPYAVDATTGAPLPVHVSVSHADGVVVAVASDAPIGCDLVTRERFSDAFLADVFVPGELAAWQAALASDEVSAMSAAFAAKEAALKWLGVGLRAALHSLRVEPVRPLEPGVYACRVTHDTARHDLRLAVQHLDAQVLVVIS